MALIQQKNGITVVIPDMIRVFYWEIPVLIVDKINEVDDLGLSEFEERVIKLKRQQEDILSTFYHEILEFINHFMQIGLRHKQIIQLEHGLFRVLKENGLMKS